MLSIVQILVGFASMLTVFFDEAAHLCFVILGGLVLWACVFLFRYLARRSSPRRRR